MSTESANGIVVGLQTENVCKIGAYGVSEETAATVGYTKGGIDITDSSTELPIKVDQHIAAIRSITIDQSMQVVVRMAQADVDNISLAFGMSPSDVSDSSLDFGDRTDAQEDYKTIYINVAGAGAAGATRKYTFHKCKKSGDVTQSYTQDGETILEVTFDVIADTSKSASARWGTIADTGGDTTPPTVALSAPADGGTVTKDGVGTVVWTITETNTIDESSIVYGDTFSIINTTTEESTALVAGSIAYSASAKTVTFTPSSAWTASDTLQAIVSTGLKDVNGNKLATMKIEQFSVTA